MRSPPWSHLFSRVSNNIIIITVVIVIAIIAVDYLNMFWASTCVMPSVGLLLIVRSRSPASRTPSLADPTNTWDRKHIHHRIPEQYIILSSACRIIGFQDRWNITQSLFISLHCRLKLVCEISWDKEIEKSSLKQNMLPFEAQDLAVASRHQIWNK